MRSSSTNKSKTCIVLRLPRINHRPPRPAFQIYEKQTQLKISQDKNLLIKKELPEITTNTLLLRGPSNKLLNDSQKSIKFKQMNSKISKPNFITNRKKVFITDKPSFPKISWNDFQGQPIENSWFLAQIFWYIDYTAIIKETKPNFKVDVTAICYINKNRSWVKNHENKDLLEHEQGHFNIGNLCCYSFQKKVKITKFNHKTYKEEIKKIFNETMKEFCDLEKKYDEETYHMLNVEMQKKWDENLLQKLKDLKT